MNARADTAPGCAFCGLPIPRPWWPAATSVQPDSGEELYCCFGCRFAARVTQSRGEQGEAAWALTRLGFAIFFTMNVMVFTMVLWTQDVYGTNAPDGERLSATLNGLFRYLCLLFALPVLVLLGGPLLENAWQGLRHGLVSIDLLLLPGVAASYVYSALSVFREQGPIYFEVGCVVLVLVTLGRWLEATGRLRSLLVIESLEKLLPEKVRLLGLEGETTIPLREVVLGATLRVLAGERIPCDGRVLDHPGTVDEQILTGESHPVVKEPGDAVHGGTLNVEGDLRLEVTAPPGTGALERLVGLVQAARRARGRFERLADRVAFWFLPAVLAVAVGAAVYHTSRHGWSQGILTSLAVLLIACPCALGLATPLAVWNALGQAARAQVLFRHGDALEQLATVRAVRLDKTGTLTTGTPRVAEFQSAPGEDAALVLARSARLARSSTHGLAMAIRRFAESARAGAEQSPEESVPAVRTLPGRGLVAELGPGETAWLGSRRLMDEQKLAWPGPLTQCAERAGTAAQPMVCIGWRGQVRGLFLFLEQLRPEAKTALGLLRGQGLDVGILTGDHVGRGAALGRELGVPIEAELLPGDKVAAIATAQQAFGRVAMVGDGINDAPALARSDVGIAMGCGADVSRDSAAICLLGDNLLRLPWAIDLARRTVRTIRLNLFWALVYNVIGIGLACVGLLNPVLAALAMVLSSLLVVSSSSRLAGSAADTPPPGHDDAPIRLV